MIDHLLSPTGSLPRTTHYDAVRTTENQLELPKAQTQPPDQQAKVSKRVNRVQHFVESHRTNNKNEINLGTRRNAESRHVLRVERRKKPNR